MTDYTIIKREDADDVLGDYPGEMRMLAGPLDFHQGSFRTVSVAEFRPRYEALGLLEFEHGKAATELTAADLLAEG